MRRTVPIKKEKHIWVPEGTSMMRIHQTNYTGHRTVCFSYLEMNTDKVKLVRYYGQVNMPISLYI